MAKSDEYLDRDGFPEVVRVEVLVNRFHLPDLLTAVAEAGGAYDVDMIAEKYPETENLEKAAKQARERRWPTFNIKPNWPGFLTAAWGLLGIVNMAGGVFYGKGMSQDVINGLTLVIAALIYGRVSGAFKDDD